MLGVCTGLKFQAVVYDILPSFLCRKVPQSGVDLDLDLDAHYD